MVPSGESIHDYSNRDKGCAEPQDDPYDCSEGGPLRDLELLQESYKTISER